MPPFWPMLAQAQLVAYVCSCLAMWAPKLWMRHHRLFLLPLHSLYIEDSWTCLSCRIINTLERGTGTGMRSNFFETWGFSLVRGFVEALMTRNRESSLRLNHTTLTSHQIYIPGRICSSVSVPLLVHLCCAKGSQTQSWTCCSSTVHNFCSTPTTHKEHDSCCCI